MPVTTGSVSSLLRSSDLLLPVSMPDGEWLITKISCNNAQITMQQGSVKRSEWLITKMSCNNAHIILLSENLSSAVGDSKHQMISE